MVVSKFVFLSKLCVAVSYQTCAKKPRECLAKSRTNFPSNPILAHLITAELPKAVVFGSQTVPILRKPRCWNLSYSDQVLICPPGSKNEPIVIWSCKNTFMKKKRKDNLYRGNIDHWVKLRLFGIGRVSPEIRSTFFCFFSLFFLIGAGCTEFTLAVEVNEVATEKKDGLRCCRPCVFFVKKFKDRYKICWNNCVWYQLRVYADPRLPASRTDFPLPAEANKSWTKYNINIYFKRELEELLR